MARPQWLNSIFQANDTDLKPNSTIFWKRTIILVTRGNNTYHILKELLE